MAQQLVAARSGQEVGFDAWLVPAPWVDLVKQARQRNGLAPILGGAVGPLARSPVVMVVPEDRAAVLRGFCQDGIDWACVGRAVEQPWSGIGGQAGWGLLKPAHDAPTRATGLVVLGQAVADRVGSATFSSRDLAADDFRRWFTALERAVVDFGEGGSTPLEDLLRFGPSRVDIVGTTEATAARLLDQAGARGAGLTVTWPEPVVTVDLVLVPVIGHEQAATRIVAAATDAAVGQALAAQGWRTGDAPPQHLAGDAPALPETSGAPSGGALEALVLLFNEVVR